MSSPLLIDQLRKSLFNQIIPKVLILLQNLELEEYVLPEDSSFKFRKIDKNGIWHLRNKGNDGEYIWTMWFNSSEEQKLSKNSTINMSELLLKGIDEMEKEQENIQNIINQANKLQILYTKQILIEKISKNA